MAGLIEELMDTVEEQISVYEQLLETAAKKKVIIIENNVEGLAEFNDIENTLIGRCTRLDKKRDSLLDDIAFVLNKKRDEMTLSRLVELIKGQLEEERLTQIRNRALDAVERLKSINELNKVLIETSLEHLDYSMNLIRGAVNPQPYYVDLAGNEVTLPGRMMFDTKQ